MLEIFSGAVPSLVICTDCAALVVFTACDPKLALPGEGVPHGCPVMSFAACVVSEYMPSRGKLAGKTDV
jgi:hypothetical protein